MMSHSIAQRRHEARDRGVGHISHGVQTAPLENLGGLRTHTPEFADGQRVKKAESVGLEAGEG